MNFVLGLLSIALVVPGPSWLGEGDHVDKRLGFQMEVPKDWSQIPLSTNERYLVGRYESKKEYNDTEKGTGYTRNHKPTLTMIAFQEEVEESITSEDTGEEGEKEKKATITFSNPYEDYLDYLKKKTSGTGWFIEAETEVETHGIKAIFYDIKIEKSTGSPMRIYTWVYQLPDVDVAVEYIFFESVLGKLKKPLLSSFKSFKAVEITEERMSHSVDFFDLFTSAKTPKERKEIRIKVVEDQRKRAVENLPDDWTFKEMGKFFVLNHSDDRQAKKVVGQLTAMFKWMDKTFPYVGPEEYVRSPIVRICASSGEERSFKRGSSWTFTNIEILTHKSESGSASYEWGYINRRAAAFWFNERDRNLWRNAPPWLDNGLNRMLHSATAKGTKMIFEADPFELDGIREAQRNDTLTSPSRLLRMPLEDYNDNETLYRESGSFVRWLMVGKGSKSRLTKNLVRDLLAHLGDVLDEREEKSEEEDEDDEEDSGPTTEAEEDEEFKKGSEERNKRFQELLDEVIQRTFSDWTDKDWKALDKAYLRSL